MLPTAATPDSSNPFARAFALHRLQQAAQAGLLGHFNPSTAKDPGAVWRALSASIASNPQELHQFLQVANPTLEVPHLPQPTPQPFAPARPALTGPPLAQAPAPAQALPGVPPGPLPHSQPGRLVGGEFFGNLGTPGLAAILTALQAHQGPSLLRYA